ncbi:Serine/threonine-protein kinase ppk23 [Tritrichomonas foetus]|uniref:cyclin-dependent kinase n=1 Tax=Tritrichomonas foetus TaxID=1144522 RepID=A0A1J4KW68_9EUKA|nr:Serine/threonine-protein kinase ppk23 [Tritrichomonas foetus]|eukprot:OHT14004.1 Serine/threonine-protein kinase ppk23 [Tritrichomonas foetus]
MLTGHGALCPTTTPLSGSISSEYDVVSHVGRGGYGNVYKAINKSTGEIVALKKVNSFDIHGGLPTSYYREVNCLKEMRGHPNIVNLKNICRSKDSSSGESCLYLVMDYCEYDLSGLIHNYGLTIRQIQSFMRQILIAVQDMHSHGYVHRDLKPSNVFVTKEGVIKVGDFGLTRKLDKSRPLTSKVITPSYRPPEVLLGDSHYDQSVDVWSLACVLYEMVTGKVLFRPSTASDLSQLLSIFEICGMPNQENWPGFDKLPNASILQMCQSPKNSNNQYSNNSMTFSNNSMTQYSNNSFSDGFSYQCKSALRELLEQTIPPQLHTIVDLLESMLQLDPRRRATIAQALEHPFFADTEQASAAGTSFELSCLPYPETHAIDVSAKIPLAKHKNLNANVDFVNKALNARQILRPARVLPPPILA